MLSQAEGNILDAQVDALVNTVNTVGVMGKGIALQFKQAFPANFQAYEAACRNGDVQLGSMFVFPTGQLVRPYFIINFPTKNHWRAKSRMNDIRAGLSDLRRVISDYEIKSVAIPPLGCGNGGLAWKDVFPVIAETLDDLTEVSIQVYPPKGPPPADAMRVGTGPPRITQGRAALLTLLSGYVGMSRVEQASATDGASLLEIQKLMYLLQEAGVNLRLKFVKAQYGPYAENLNHVLQALEGHYLRGYGDRTQEVLQLSPISLLPEAAGQGSRWLADNSEQTAGRVAAVHELIEGFASAYGLELLATVHWVLTREMDSQTQDLDKMMPLILDWNRRKGRLFTKKHVSRAVEQLSQQGWLGSSLAFHS